MLLDQPIRPMTEWMDEYAESDDLNEKYRILREEVRELRDKAEISDRFHPDDPKDTIRQLSDRVDGHLLVFAANDFGRPVAYRPEGVEIEAQNEIRLTLLDRKYDEHEDLNELRRELLDAHPKIHKAIIAEYRDGNIRYHLPEGSNETANFITVREMVGLVDWTTHNGASVTY